MIIIIIIMIMMMIIMIMMIIIIIIIIHIPNITAVQSLIKTVPVSLTKHFFTLLP